MYLTTYLKDNNLDATSLKTHDDFQINESKDGKLISIKYKSGNKSKEYMSRKEIQQARGVVYEKETMTVVARMFDRFFNKGEPINKPVENVFDYSNFTTFVKEDGSLIGLYHYDNNWNVCTSGVPDAQCSLDDRFEFVFQNKFKELLELSNVDLNLLNKDYVYIWELVTPELNMNPEPKSYIKILGIRDMSNDTEILYKDIDVMFTNLNLKHLLLKYWTNKSIRDIELELLNMDSYLEGFVICDSNFNRMKYKNKRWSERKRDNYSSVKDFDLVSIWLAGEHHKLIAERAFIFAKVFEKFEYVLNTVTVEVNDLFKLLKPNTTRIDFAKSTNEGLAYNFTNSVRHWILKNKFNDDYSLIDNNQPSVEFLLEELSPKLPNQKHSILLDLKNWKNV